MRPFTWQRSPRSSPQDCRLGLGEDGNDPSEATEGDTDHLQEVDLKEEEDHPHDDEVAEDLHAGPQ